MNKTSSLELIDFSKVSRERTAGTSPYLPGFPDKLWISAVYPQVVPGKPGNKATPSPRVISKVPYVYRGPRG